MTSEPDPLDSWVRPIAEAVPVPASLVARIRRSVARKRIAGSAAVAAAALLVAGLSVWWSSPRTKPGEGPTAGPFVSLMDPSPPPVELGKSQFTARVSATREGLVFRFKDGGKSDE